MTVLSVLIIICSILLILVVIVQNSKGGGLDSNIASQNQAFGAQKTTELVEKLTWGLAAALIVFSIMSTKIISQEASSGIEDETIDTVDDDEVEDQELEGQGVENN
jgi:preprotein translocase subunit SecG